MSLGLRLGSLQHKNPVNKKIKDTLLRKSFRTPPTSTRVQSEFRGSHGWKKSSEPNFRTGSLNKQMKRVSSFKKYDSFLQKCFEEAFMQKIYLEDTLREKQKQFSRLDYKVENIRGKEHRQIFSLGSEKFLPQKELGEMGSIKQRSDLTERYELFEEKKSYFSSLKNDLMKIEVSKGGSDSFQAKLKS